MLKNYFFKTPLCQTITEAAILTSPRTHNTDQNWFQSIGCAILRIASTSIAPRGMLGIYLVVRLYTNRVDDSRADVRAENTVNKRKDSLRTEPRFSRVLVGNLPGPFECRVAPSPLQSVYYARANIMTRNDNQVYRGIYQHNTFIYARVGGVWRLRICVSRDQLYCYVYARVSGERHYIIYIYV